MNSKSKILAINNNRDLVIEDVGEDSQQDGPAALIHQDLENNGSGKDIDVEEKQKNEDSDLEDEIELNHIKLELNYYNLTYLSLY